MTITSHDRISQHDDRNTQHTPEEPGPSLYLKPLDSDSGREKQDKSSSATAPGSPRPHRHSIEPSHPQINQENDQSRTGNVRLEEFRRGSPLCSQDQGEGPQEQQQRQQRQEVAGEAMREDDDKEPEQRGEKQWHLDEAEVCSDIHISRPANAVIIQVTRMMRAGDLQRGSGRSAQTLSRLFRLSVTMVQMHPLNGITASPYYQPRNSRSTSTVFDCVGYAPGSLLDARQRQLSTESYGVNIQTGLILGLTQTTCGCQCYGHLANDPLET
ncbi:hypothetical protein BDZ45DRAFT_699380 [Acephala macrosclerotiorum]|nr:hypothetical protein BDZ45DRAFT_699380 [Acephala macrosclerotiorum]